MLNICIVFVQMERESIQMRVTDAFYSRCAKGYYMRGWAPYGFDTEPETSYGDITRYFTENEIQVYGKTLKRGFVAQLLRSPVYFQADMDIYEHFKAQGAKIESPRNCSRAIIAVTYTKTGRGNFRR